MSIGAVNGFGVKSEKHHHKTPTLHDLLGLVQVFTVREVNVLYRLELATDGLVLPVAFVHQPNAHSNPTKRQDQPQTQRFAQKSNSKDQCKHRRQECE